MTEPTAHEEVISAVKEGYAFEDEAVQLGVLEADGPVVDAPVRIPVSMFNRHGLVAGATGTGKTVTLQVMAEALSNAGVPVFLADIKGDLSGMATPGAGGEKLLARTSANGQPWEARAFPCEFYALGGQGIGVPLRATVTAFGPILLSKVLGLNEVQESSLGLVFYYADSNGLPLLDLKDLTELLKYLTSDEGKPELKGIGGVSSATAGVILRNLLTLQQQGGDVFFGEPEFDPKELLRTAPDGRGVVSLLELPDLASRPDLFSTFLMWLLADLYQDLPEVGDVERPKLVFFFDEAHLLFNGASDAFLQAITQTVRLIRSKGVGVFFVTQTPKDVPADVLAQLGSRVQHQLRAHTPNAAKALRATVSTYPRSGYDLEQVLQQLGTGEAVVTVMDPDGAPTPVAWTRIWAPESTMGPTDAEALRAGVAQSQLMARYGQAVDRDSAHEMLIRKVEEGARAAEEQARAEAERQEAEARRKESGPTSRSRSTGPSRSRKEPGLVEQVTGSTAFKQFARTAAREIVRSLFGTGRRR
ncbi:helicase HerA-like domain-containing protein [Tessaracoccus rhinocerotis]|uniref:helicase HerA-like domain-containing protein n=1 Tax=Tessaracoccus rhinocerotis TaxID=1689449 RepID=UPI001FECD685|nr:helicase HerA-like domain-containing protein [Tessaracoccus rhinocerotis]